MKKVHLRFLGQSGIRFQFGNDVLYTDPYLSDHVAQLYGDDLRRLAPVPIQPGQVTDADWVLITHHHLDHCDPWTLAPIAEASRECRFICPSGLQGVLGQAGIAAERIVPAGSGWIGLGSDLRVSPVPAAHPTVEFDERGEWRYLGYVIDYGGRRFYHAGDTSPDPAVIEAVNRLGPIDVAFLPVNERNFYREQAGIIGNMSIREAFRMGEDIGINTMVPIHWDLFEPNSVFPEELTLLHRLIRPQFEMLITPAEV